MDPQAKMRVKVYQLRTGNQWIDQGTGHCSYEFNHEKSEGTLIVHSEDDEDKILLSSLIRYGEELYQRQQDTLIVWSEEEGLDLALSFQEVEGCGEIWDNIQEIQQQYADGLFSDRSDVNVAGMGETVTLPDPEMSNLAEIESAIKEAQGGMNEKEKLASFIVAEKYIPKLFPVFEACEDLESIEDLHVLHGIMLGIILLNDQPLIECIISDGNIIHSVGMLEYEPDLGNEKENYRDFLMNKSKYKEIVPINNPGIETKIHEIFRALFLRDTVLSRVMDESLMSTFASILFFHNIEIVNYIHQDRQFQTDLFGILADPSSTLDRKRDVVLFVQQFCAIAKTTQMPARVGLYRTLSQNGLFNIFEMALSDTEQKIKMAGAEILLSAMEHDPNLVRSYIVKQSEDQDQKQLMDVLLDQMLVEEDVGIKLQYSEVLRVLLDTNPNQMDNGMQIVNNTTPHDPDLDKFLDLFYQRFVEKLVSPMLALPEVRSHSFRSKYYVLSSGIVAKMCLLFKNRDQHLRLCALRFFRTCIGLNDEFYIRYLVKHNVAQHVVDLLLSTNNKNNLLNSACIEFFEYIRHENVKLMVSHIVSLHGERLKQIQYVDTFNQLIRRFEQQNDKSMADTQTTDAATSEAGSAMQGQARPGDGWTSTTVDDDEEAYFNNSDDEDEVPDEEKSNDPPVSDLRRRVKESEDSDDEETTKSDMDHEPEPELPLLSRRKLVDYGEDEDEDDPDNAFGQLLKASSSASSSASPSKSDSSSPPPSKKPKLDENPEAATPLSPSSSNTLGSSSGDGSLSPGSPQKKEGTTGGPIKFKLNTLRNGRSPSPLASTKPVKSRSVSPLPSATTTQASSGGLPPVSTRTGIVFVKAGTEPRDGNGDPKLSSLEEVTPEAATHLRSDLATEFKLSAALASEQDSATSRQNGESTATTAATTSAASAAVQSNGASKRKEDVEPNEEPPYLGGDKAQETDGSGIGTEDTATHEPS
ncbi:Platinum sensitivity protein [Podila minutissima]|nr:Platinum sensitivity protein [Podila minutissima]